MIKGSCLMMCCLLVAVLAADKYSDKYDNTNVVEILENKALLRAYVDCILDKGKCTPQGKEIKGNIQDGLETGCAKCTDKQKELLKTIALHLINYERAIWNEITAKFDPKGEWKKKYEAIALENGVVLPKE